jgi:hypothetical protein
VSRESLPRLPSQRKADSFQMLPHVGCPSLIGWRHLWQAFPEGLAWTRGMETAVASRMEMETDGYDTERHLGHDAYEPALCTPGAPLTIWAPCRTAGRGELDDELLLFEADGIDLQTCPVRKHGRKERGQMHEGNSTNGDETTRASAPVVLPPQPAVREAPQLAKNRDIGHSM